MIVFTAPPIFMLDVKFFLILPLSLQREGQSGGKRYYFGR
jgi:hypothetical protein